jgi:lysophospholipase L1-like esterase
MKPLSILLLAALFCSFNMQQKKKIIFFGDSITQQGKDPEGYITKLDRILEEKKLGGQYELIGAGIGGNKVYDLYLRLEDDVLAKKPDAVVIWIGVNDVWHKRSLGTGTDADKFKSFYNAILKKLKENNITVYLCTPAVIGERTDCTNEQDGELNHYSKLIRGIAKEQGCTLIDLRQDFMDYLNKNNPDNKDRGILTTDRVHLNATGNSFVADRMFQALSKGFIKNQSK